MSIRFLVLSFLFTVLGFGTANAYVGPGLGLGAIGAILGVILSVFLAIFAIFWYPIKRMLKKKKPSAKDEPKRLP